jgi:CHAT domain-containing protein
VIPDGALAYVPFAALRARSADRVQYVVEQHDVALTPARWMLRETPAAATAPRRLLVVADPIYERDDARLLAGASGTGARRAAAEVGSPAAPVLRRLPWTAREASDIAAEFKPSDVTRLVGPDATRERLLALDWSQFRFIHVATHGLLDAASPPLSALMLGSYDAHGAPLDGAVRVADLSLRSFAAELVVFSACETALGRDVASEGLVGIGYTALARGAQSVVASLWRVPDETSSRLMTDLYRHLLRDSNDAPAALGAAMRAELARAPQADPALWAPFQVSVMTTGRAPSRGRATSAAAHRPATPAGLP